INNHRVRARRDDEFRPGVDRLRGLLCCQHSSRAEEDFRKFRADPRDRFSGGGGAKCDLGARQQPCELGLGEWLGTFESWNADDWNDPDLLNLSYDTHRDICCEGVYGPSSRKSAINTPLSVQAGAAKISSERQLECQLPIARVAACA